MHRAISIFHWKRFVAVQDMRPVVWRKNAVSPLVQTGRHGVPPRVPPFQRQNAHAPGGRKKASHPSAGGFCVFGELGGARAAMRAAEKPPLQSGAALIACQSNAADRIRKSRRNSIPSGFEEEKRDFLRSPCIFWWSWGELNSRPLECHSSALPTELQPLEQVRILPQTSHVVNSRMRCCGTFRLSCRGQACTSRYTLSVFHPSAYPPFGCRRKKAA